MFCNFHNGCIIFPTLFNEIFCGHRWMMHPPLCTWYIILFVHVLQCNNSCTRGGVIIWNSSFRVFIIKKTFSYFLSSSASFRHQSLQLKKFNCHPGRVNACSIHANGSCSWWIWLKWYVYVFVYIWAFHS